MTDETMTDTVVPEPETSEPRRRHPANVVMVVATALLVLLLVGAVFAAVAARNARSELQNTTAARVRTTHTVRARTDRVRADAQDLTARARAVVAAYSALDDALVANAGAQRAYVEAVNGAVDRYNAGDAAGSQGAFDGDVQAKLDELTRRTAAAVAAQQSVEQAEQKLQEVSR
jgi:hypothetical protein